MEAQGATRASMDGMPGRTSHTTISPRSKTESIQSSLRIIASFYLLVRNYRWRVVVLISTRKSLLPLIPNALQDAFVTAA